MKLPKVGDLVGAGRWPRSSAHPDGWGRPWSGVVLAQDDPRAWFGTLAFPCRDDLLPDPEKVRIHVAWCHSQGLLGDRVPVLWSFGKVYWEAAAEVCEYETDLAAWERARRRDRRRERVVSHW